MTLLWTNHEAELFIAVPGRVKTCLESSWPMTSASAWCPDLWDRLVHLLNTLTILPSCPSRCLLWSWCECLMQCDFHITSGVISCIIIESTSRKSKWVRSDLNRIDHGDQCALSCVTNSLTFEVVEDTSLHPIRRVIPIHRSWRSFVGKNVIAGIAFRNSSNTAVVRFRKSFSNIP